MINSYGLHPMDQATKQNVVDDGKVLGLRRSLLDGDKTPGRTGSHVHLGPPCTTFTTPRVMCSVCIADLAKPSSQAVLDVAFTVGHGRESRLVTLPTHYTERSRLRGRVQQVHLCAVLRNSLSLQISQVFGTGCS